MPVFFCNIFALDVVILGIVGGWWLVFGSVLILAGASVWYTCDKICWQCIVKLDQVVNRRIPIQVFIAIRKKKESHAPSN